MVMEVVEVGIHEGRMEQLIYHCPPKSFGRTRSVASESIHTPLFYPYPTYRTSPLSPPLPLSI